MRLNKGNIVPKKLIRNFFIPKKSIRNQASRFRGPEGSNWVQASGIWVQCSTYRDYFTVLLFYFFKKKNYWNIGTNRSTIY